MIASQLFVFFAYYNEEPVLHFAKATKFTQDSPQKS